MPKKLVTKSRVATQTQVALLLVAGFAAAAGIGYVGLNTPAGKSFRASVAKVMKNASVPAAYYTPGYTIPGYTPPGYPSSGYVPPAYIPSGYVPGGMVPGMAYNCSKDGWAIARSVTTLKNIPTSRPIKGSGATLYWYGKDKKRYVIPNEKTYRTWFPLGSRCQTIVPISDADLAKVALGGTTRYKPLTRMIKITTDPKVYVVTKGGVLHWLASESVAAQAYGNNWKTMVDDVPDGFFVNYTRGTDIKALKDFQALANQGASTIDQDLGL